MTVTPTVYFCWLAVLVVFGVLAGLRVICAIREEEIEFERERLRIERETNELA